MRVHLALGLVLGLGAIAVSTGGAAPLDSRHTAFAVKAPAHREIAVKGTVVYEQVDASALRSALKVVGVDGVGARFLTPLAPPGEVRADCCARFSPDGQRVAFLRQFRSGRALELVAVGGGPSYPLITQAQATRLSRQRARLEDVVWSPDGKRLAVSVHVGKQSCSGSGVLAVDADGSHARWLVPLSFAPKDALLSIGAWSPSSDQILVVAASNDGDCYSGHERTNRLLLVHDEPGQRPHSILTSNPFMEDAVWSADGSRIAVETGCDEICNIVTLDPSGRAVKTLTHFRVQQSQSSTGRFGAAIAWRNIGDELIVLHGNKLFVLGGLSGRPGAFTYTLPCNASCAQNEIFGSLDGSLAGIVLAPGSGQLRLVLVALSGAGARSLALPLSTDDIWLG